MSKRDNESEAQIATFRNYEHNRLTSRKDRADYGAYKDKDGLSAERRREVEELKEQKTYGGDVRLTTFWMGKHEFLD